MMLLLDEYELDKSRFELRRNGLVVPMQRLPLELLFYLVLHRDRVVSRNELLSELWRGIHVTDGALSTGIYALRRALRDEDHLEPWIRTVRGKGFRYEGPCEPSGVSSEADQALSATARAAPELPADLARLLRHALVGRAEERPTLRARFDRCPPDSHSIVILGEAGVGKSRLAAEVADWGFREGKRVMFGRCTERLDLAYQPFAQALEAQGYELQQSERLAPTEIALGTGRHRLFSSVSDMFVELSTQGAVLVIDDFQWASEPTVALLEHIASVARPPGLLLVATLRDTDIEAGSGQAALIDEMVRRGDATQIRLGGFDRDEVQQYLTLVDLDASASAVDAVARSTAGNALLLTELAHEAAAAGASRIDTSATDAVPAAIANLVATRMARLGPGADLLHTAALIGDSFELSVLERATDDDPLPTLELARKLGLVEELRPDAWQFRHGLTRDALSAVESAGRLARRHERIADALVDEQGRTLDMARRAEHLIACGRSARVTEAIECAVVAAHERLWQVSPDDALEVIALVAPLLDSNPDIDATLVTDLHLAEVDAHSQRFAEPQRLAAADRAYEAAQRSGAPIGLARAALARSGFWTQGDLDTALFSRLENVLTLLSTPTNAAEIQIRSRVLAHLSGLVAVAGASAPPMSRTPLEMAIEASELAEQTNDDFTLMTAFSCQIVALWNGPNAKRQLELADRIARIDHVEAPVLAARWQAAPHLILGDRKTFDSAVEVLVRDARALDWRQIHAHGVQCQAMAAMLDGDFERAAEFGKQAVEIGRGHPNFARIHGAQLFWKAYEEGELAGLLPFIELALAEDPEVASFHSMLGVSLCEVGELDRARAELDFLSRDGFEWIPRDILWSSAIAGSIEISVAIDSKEHANTLERLLEPFQGQLLVVAGGSFVYGAIDRFLGMAASMQGHHKSAAARFRAAEKLERQVGGEILAERTRQWSKRLLGT